MKAYLGAPEDVLRELGVDARRGLTEEEVRRSRERHGRNAFTRTPPPSLAARVAAAASEPLILMLIAAGLITLGVNVTRLVTGGEADFFECAGIFAAIGLSVVISVVMEQRSASAFEELSRIGEEGAVRVVRAGEVVFVPRTEVVVGDILRVETGDRIPADARLVEANCLSCDESALTGESEPAAKAARLPVAVPDGELPVAERATMLHAGCFVTGGDGVAVVVAVGDDTEFGAVARALSTMEDAATPLQEKMAALGKRISIAGITAAAVVFLIQLALFLRAGTATLDTVSEAFITSIVLIVAAVPEGLPTIVAVSLAISVIKMSRQNALVKKMIACETVGCINVICSDKTGTLTQNRMTVREVYGAAGERCDGGSALPGLLVENFAVNSSADVHMDEGAPAFVGNPTECALLVAAQGVGVDYRARREAARRVHVYPFSSEEKRMTSVVAAARGEAGAPGAMGACLVLTKGSPERVLEMCDVEPAARTVIEGRIAACQERALRVLAFAHKECAVEGAAGGGTDAAATAKSGSASAEPAAPACLTCADFARLRPELESHMTFDGFVAISDPLRPDVAAAVERCRAAGIDLKILTGDNVVTATAIARELGLDTEGSVALARDIERMDDEELRRRIGGIHVIARSTPAVKMRVVQALKRCGDVVAVTGDGINDAPAIRAADVGVAMGVAGTEVSKEASDIVLLDDGFSTIVKAVQWGRGIYENFQRFIQFQLTVNLSSVVVVLFSILAGFKAPFTALQLLWVNIIMDGPPALTLGLEPIRGNLMDRAPTRRDASIVSRGMLARIVVNGLFISGVFMAQHFGNFLGATDAEQSTALFTLFVMFQLMNAFNSRELSRESIFSNLGSNRLMLGVFLLTFALQVLIVQVGGVFFGTVPLRVELWGRILLTASSVIAVGEALRAAERMRAR